MCDLDELLGLIVNVANHKCFVQVAMVAVIVGCDVHIANITILFTRRNMSVKYVEAL